MAYALQPLICILEQQLDLDCYNITPQLETLLAKAKCLRDFIENIDKSSENKDLESRIRDAAYEAEDVIESYILDSSDSGLDLTEVMEIFDSINEELLSIVGENDIQSSRSLLSFPDQRAALDWKLEMDLQYIEGNIMVGHDLELIHLKHLLFQHESHLKIIPVVGIGGVGKTTLVKRLYTHSSNSGYFDVEGWTTISQKYNLKMNLIDLLRSMRMFNNQMRHESDDELGERVRNTLRRRRYLIVVDDIWDIDAWDKMRSLFPEDRNGSRVILTTRQLNVADYARSSSELHQMRLLDADESWKLLARKVFRYEDLCPPELVETGKNISQCAQGLPLALITMAGHLSTLEKTLKVWKVFEEQQINSVEKIQEVDSNKNEISETRDNPVMEGTVNLFLKDGHQLIQLFTQRQKELKIIPIVGMGGSGKTTLARLVYNRLLHAGCFDIHAWITSSGHKKTKDALREILDSLREGMGTREEMPHVSDDGEVGEHVHKTLYQRRYLVVLDDIKDANNWDVLKKFFPDNNNGSRIILTAREWNKADYDGITPFRINSYWEFLLQKAFEQDFVSSKIEDKILTFWKLFETNQRSGDIKRDSQFDLISISYDHLPCHLKPCFLYMGAFPEDYEIKVSKIINLWIAEGFVKPTEIESFESAAEEYLKALLDRNLLFASQRDLHGKVDTIRIHDIFWKFCRKKAFEENFMWCKDSEVQNTPENEEEVRRVSVHSLSEDSDWMDLYWARSLLCVGSVSQDLAPIILELRLLRVLDVLQFVSAEFPEEMLQMLNLRYLALTCLSHIPSSISDLQHLQTFIVPGASSLPSELWTMKQLRHINCKQTQTWSFPEENGDSSVVVQENLHTLSNVPLSVMSEVFLRKIPNIRKLRIFCDVMINAWVCLDRLHMLESLKCSSADGSPDTRNFLSYLLFPNSLKKLTLRSCEIGTEDIHRIGELPCLEQLKLQKCGFMHREWEPIDGHFLNLKVLHVEDSNLVKLYAEDIHFPRLERLIIRGCHSMKVIPCYIADIPTLELIEVSDCLLSLVDSALAILDEQLEFGNDQLRVFILNTRTD